MGWEGHSTDQLQQRLVDLEAERSRIAAEQLEILEELDRRQVHTMDGCRSLGEWTAMVLDTTLDDARSRVRVMRRTADRPGLRRALADGVSFARIEALSRIFEDVGLGLEWDVAGLCREAARRVRVSGEDEARWVEERFLVMQPSLGEGWWRVWGGLDAYAGEIVDRALSGMAERLPGLPEDHGHLSARWRKATALVELCMGGEAPKAEVSVFVTAREAGDTAGEAGVVLESGSKVGRRTLEAILCGSSVQVYAVTEQGEYLRYGRRYRLATREQVQALMHRYGGRCAAAPGPPPHPLVTGRADRPRRPGPVVLVPPPRRGPPVGLPHLPPPRHRPDQVPPTRRSPRSLIPGPTRAQPKASAIRSMA